MYKTSCTFVITYSCVELLCKYQFSLENLVDDMLYVDVDLFFDVLFPFFSSMVFCNAFSFVTWLIADNSYTQMNNSFDMHLHCLCVCVSMRVLACLPACVRACVRVCVRACVRTYRYRILLLALIMSHLK